MKEEMFINLSVIMKIMMLKFGVGGIIQQVLVQLMAVIGWLDLEWLVLGQLMTGL